MIYTIENTSQIGKLVIVRRNGKIVKNCFYADTKRGIVKTYGRKPKINKTHDAAIQYTNYGKVTVEPSIKCKQN